MKPVTVITGATGDIGAALAHALKGHELILLGRDSAKLEALKATLPDAHTVTLELRKPDEFAASLEGVRRVDNLIHNAGVAQLGTVAEASLEVWRELLEVNLLAAVELTRVLLPRLREARGQVLFVNSGAGLTANAGWSAYAASKFALRAFAESLALEEPGLRVQSVYPGRTATAMQERVRAHEGAPYEPERLIQPETLAATIRTMLELPRDSVLTQVIVNRVA
jgi:short-subunit dehydrogenase